MYVFEQDEYAETHHRSGPRLSLWLLWVLATGVSFFLARLIVQQFDRVEQFGGLLYWGFLMSIGAVQGAIIGAAQGLVLLFYLKRTAWAQWVLATAVGWALRSLLLYLTSNALDNVFLGLKEPGLLVAEGLGGMLLGMAIGLPQSFVLRSYVEHPGWWVLLSGGGAVLGRAVAAMGLLAGMLDDAVNLNTVDATMMAAVTGAIMVDMLRSSRKRVAAPQRRESAPTPGIVSLELAVHGLGQDAEVGSGLFLTFHNVEISSDSIIWQGIVRNDTGEALDFRLPEGVVQVTDNTGKPYPISSVAADSECVPAHGDVGISVIARVLAYSPIPPGATHLDLHYAQPGGSNPASLLFRRDL